MQCNYLFEITGGPSLYCSFAYIDTEDHVADVLFTCEHVDAEIRNEYILRNSPYRIVECRVPISQRESFLDCMDLLPAAMECNGMTDFEDYSRNFMEKADRMLAGEDAPGGGWTRGTENPVS